MALKPCKECGCEVSTKARNCPNCGAPIPGRIKLSFIIVITLGIALLIALFTPNQDKKEQKENVTQSATSLAVQKESILDHEKEESQDEVASIPQSSHEKGPTDSSMNVQVNPNPTSWWNEMWEYRLPFTINANGIARSNHPAEIPVNFSDFFATLGETGDLDINSIRVIEVNARGDVLDEEVPFQFDPAQGFDPGTNAAGTVVLILEGTTTGDRFYHLFFDVIGTPFPPPTVSPQVTVTDDVLDERQNSYQIATPTATYLFQKQAAGFSSLVDADGNDWINYHPTGGSAGNFRGIPNLVFPEGQLHPGDATSTSTIVNQGPIKATIHSITKDTLWEALWEFYPEYAKLTVLNTNHDYWFLYEGTPGVTLEPATDFVVRSDGTSTMTSGNWEGDLTGEEWVYVGDPTLGRSLFIAHHENDAVVDSYRPHDGVMTVVAFGRGLGTTISRLSQVPAHFTIGLMDETVFSSAQPIIQSAYQDLLVSSGSPERKVEANQPPSVNAGAATLRLRTALVPITKK